MPYDQPPGEAVHERSGEEEEQRVRQDAGGLDGCERAGVVAETERLESDGDRVDAVAGDRYRLPAPQEGVVAVAQRAGEEPHGSPTLKAPMERRGGSEPGVVEWSSSKRPVERTRSGC